MTEAALKAYLWDDLVKFHTLHPDLYKGLTRWLPPFKQAGDILRPYETSPDELWELFQTASKASAGAAQRAVKDSIVQDRLKRLVGEEIYEAERPWIEVNRQGYLEYDGNDHMLEFNDRFMSLSALYRRQHGLPPAGPHGLQPAGQQPADPDVPTLNHPQRPAREVMMQPDLM
jgi:hypothetical protein